jgi:trimeric autotransporter adhesin
MTTLRLRKSTNPSPLRRGFILIPLVLVCLGLWSKAYAVSPEPDGGYIGNNTAEGEEALLSLTSGRFNTADGTYALRYLTTGEHNTATGAQALKNITTGGGNTANGTFALWFNFTGENNTATGYEALYNNQGTANTADGVNALRSNTSGIHNTADGVNALFNNTIGSSNIALGSGAGTNLTTGSNNIDIGNHGVAGESDKIRIGTVGTQTTTFIAGIHGKHTGDVGSTTAVVIDMNGNLGTTASSERFKKDIGSMDKASEAVLALKPVTFHYKNDANGILQFGLVAEEVEKVNSALVVRDAKGEVYTVRYEAVNAMLLNEFLKEYRTVQELKSVVAKQEATAAHQQKQIEALTTGLQKVSVQLDEQSRAANDQQQSVKLRQFNAAPPTIQLQQKEKAKI